MREVEPSLGQAAGAIFHAGAAHLTDPEQTAMLLVETLAERGGRFLLDEVVETRPGADGIDVIGTSRSWTVDRFLVTTGLSAGSLLRPYRVAVPLQAERGYHLTLPDSAPLLTRPLTFHEESCVATPLSGGLRIAGTVEFAPEEAEPDWSRADRLGTFAQRYFHETLLQDGATRWLGCRPSLPDSLPAIGCLEVEPRIAYAFGHQHLGLTQAAVTAELVSDLVAGGPATACAPYRIERF